MQKPNNYDNVQVGTWTPVELGGHKLVIKSVKEQESRTGKPMIVIAFDFDKTDKQPNYFADEFAKDVRPEKKWPSNGVKYLMVYDGRTNETSRDFKTFITSVEDSNKGFVTKWGDEFVSQFKNKKVGAVFGEVENEYNGKVTMRHELRWFCAYDKADSAAIPNPKLLKKSAPAPGTEDFMQVNDSEEDIPF